MDFKKNNIEYHFLWGRMLSMTIFLAFIIVFVGCSPIYSLLFGVRNIKKVDIRTNEKFIQNFDTDSLMIKLQLADSNVFVEKLPQLVSDSLTRKYLSQPIQIMYFIDSLVSFQVNCLAPGSLLSGLNWNYNQRFDYFPPHNSLQNGDIKIDKNLLYQLYHVNFKTNKKIFVLFIWSNTVHREARKAFNEMLNNIRKFKQENNVFIYLINTDGAYLNIK